ncbi:response regulator [Piscinibacter sakaiensis]|uniref:Putative two-component system response regulator n=1 Tax=Piscinibacter sakaiensis TaxID=1547922 RepID=A0A0K8P241_PISS1|nr:response regulator [Piscinibacter sakaiensis]GAP36629.1 putative two-component system response regulator [Piscinibacter sakaiensis]
MTDRETSDEVRVVLVDDDPLVCDAVCAMLELDGYTVFSATAADAALDLIAAQAPHCVITDLHMPGVDGLELTRRVRALCDPATVLIVLTGSGSEADHAQAERAGADFVLMKPLEAERLRTMLPPLE